MKIIETQWITTYNGISIGFALCHDETMDLYTVRMGAVRTPTNQKDDGIVIAQSGVRLLQREAIAFFPHRKDILETKYKVQ